VSEWLKKAADIELLKTGLTGEPSLILALALMEFAIAEEIIFRLGIQNGLAKLFRLRGNGYWLAIAVSAALWALAHGNVINPAWVKMVQIFPIGLALGFLFRKYGVEACIVAHGIFNVVMMFWAPLLITE
jgi:membrane protease YdiL (CAAX protease family)